MRAYINGKEKVEFNGDLNSLDFPKENDWNYVVIVEDVATCTRSEKVWLVTFSEK